MGKNLYSKTLWRGMGILIGWTLIILNPFNRLYGQDFSMWEDFLEGTRFTAFSAMPNVSASTIHPSLSENFKIRLHAIATADDDGSNAVTISPCQVQTWVGETNKVLETSEANLTIQFDPNQDFERQNNTLLNQLTWDPIGIAEANRISGDYPGKMVVIFRNGEGGGTMTGNGFSTLEMNFIAMPGNPHVSRVTVDFKSTQETTTANISSRDNTNLDLWRPPGSLHQSFNQTNLTVWEGALSAPECRLDFVPPPPAGGSESLAVVGNFQALGGASTGESMDFASIGKLQPTQPTGPTPVTQPNLYQLAHDFGHFLGMPHTFPGVSDWDFGTAADLINFLQNQNGSMNDFDGDAYFSYPSGMENAGSFDINDTPPDVGTSIFVQNKISPCNPPEYLVLSDLVNLQYTGILGGGGGQNTGSNSIPPKVIIENSQITLQGTIQKNNSPQSINMVFNPDRGNVMSYFACSDVQTFTPNQVARMRRNLFDHPKRKHLICNNPDNRTVEGICPNRLQQFYRVIE